MKKKMILVAVVALAITVMASACGKDSSHNNHRTEGQKNGSTDQPANASVNEEPSGGHGNHGGTQTEGAAQAMDGIQAEFVFADGKPSANQESELTIAISNEDGTPVKEFTENHEKLLHLIVVDHSLGYFNHIHPTYRGDGKFTIDTAFPQGGKYKVFADFIPAGGSNLTKSAWVEVGGQESEHYEMKSDALLIKEDGGKEVELNLSSSKAGEEVVLSFDIRDASTKEGITNLEQYLGAVGHVVILSEDAGQYIHVHPMEEKATGPEAKFKTTFPKSGTYKIWGQFQHEGVVFTLPYVIDVTE